MLSAFEIMVNILKARAYAYMGGWKYFLPLFHRLSGLLSWFFPIPEPLNHPEPFFHISLMRII